MNFEQFLINNPETTPSPQPVKDNLSSTKNDKTEHLKSKRKDNTHSIKNNNKIVDEHSRKNNKKILESYKFNSGDYVTITYVEKSYLNDYKGHIGQIIEYIPNKNYAYIRLESKIYPKTIKFPIGHFEYRKI